MITWTDAFLSRAKSVDQHVENHGNDQQCIKQSTKSQDLSAQYNDSDAQH